ncbi:transposase [Nonomuraea sp. NPDC005983]|uniref:transposase n=1 Tax=Nonomuraea sp. NPDC005983 TaxID=3155595 RepID=UPI0033A5D790
MSDLTDAEWTVLEGEARAVMAELVAATGRPMVHDLRATLDAINYVTRYGIEWRALPVDFPAHQAVYAFFLRWSRRGLPEQPAGRLRVLAGRCELPTAGTFAWLTRYRRLVRIYERKPEHHEALIWWATVNQMTRRLTRELAGQSPQGRWTGPPPLPALTSPDRRGKVLQLLAAQPWRAWRGNELAAILGIENVNSFRVQLSQWSHQGYINKIGPALYGPMPTST